MEKAQIKGLLKKYGYNTVSYQSLMDGMNYFKSSLGIEGFIPYIKVKGVFLAAGDPICADDKVYELVNEFRKKCKQEKAYCCFLSASEGLKHKLEIMGFGNLKIGEEGIFDLPSYNFHGSRIKDVRNLVNHAKSSGVLVKRMENPDEMVFSEISSINKEWLNTRKVKGFSFLLTLNPAENFEDKVILIAEYGNKIVGYVACVPIYKRNGMYFEDLIRSDDAPNGTNHLLVYEAVNYLKSKGYVMATLGTSPLGNIKDTDNLEYKGINKILEYVYEHLGGFYNFKGIHEFKDTFNPSSWEKKYLSFYPPAFKPKLLFAIIKAYNPGGVTGVLLSKLQKIFLKNG